MIKNGTALRMKSRKITKRASGQRGVQDANPMPILEKKLWTEVELADRWNLSPVTLKKWRCLRTNRLPFLKVGKTIFYRESDLAAFEAFNIVVPIVAGPTAA